MLQLLLLLLLLLLLFSKPNTNLKRTLIYFSIMREREREKIGINKLTNKHKYLYIKNKAIYI